MKVPSNIPSSEYIKINKLEKLLALEPRCDHFLKNGECGCFKCSEVIARNNLRLFIKKEMCL